MSIICELSLIIYILHVSKIKIPKFRKHMLLFFVGHTVPIMYGINPALWLAVVTEI